jgi:hypothetical protein
MAGFATEADLKAALDAGNVFYDSFSKDAGGGLTTLATVGWWDEPTRPAAGATPATTPGTSYSNTAGGIVYPDLSPVRKFVVSFGVKQNVGNVNNGAVYLWDRLVAVSGIAMSSTGDKTINSTALPRYTDGVGVQVWLEVTTAGTTTAPVCSMSSYTDQDGNTGQAGGSITFPAIALSNAHLVGPMPLAAGDTGVRSVETINVSVAGGGSGVVNVVLVKPLLSIGIAQAQAFERLSPRPFYPPIRVYDGATLMLAGRWTGTSSDAITGWITTVFG